MPLLHVANLQKSYDGALAVAGVTFSVESGTIFGLLGPNGAGKTTTLECILGLRRPDAGSITLAGIDALGQPAAVKPLIGAQLQATALQDKITPRQALKLFGGFYRDPVPAEQLLSEFDLTEKADAAFDTLSGGQKQRLAAALALVNNPQLVILDEPTAGLDPLARRQLHGMIRWIAAAGRTIILSTHYLEEAEQLCDTVAVMNAGRIVAMGSPAQLIATAAAPPRVRFRVERAIPQVDATELHARTARAGAEPTQWILETTDTNRSIVALVEQLQNQGNQLLDLQIIRPSLEDVFVERAGRAWQQDMPIS